MGARGSQLSRALAFFREGNLDEARVAFTLVGEIVTARLKNAVNSAGRQTSALSMPRKTRGKKLPSPPTAVVTQATQAPAEQAATAAS